MHLHFHSNPIRKCIIHLHALNVKDMTGKIGSACTVHALGLALLKGKELESMVLHEVIPEAPLQRPSTQTKNIHNNDSYMR
jgi:hypothetical protein